MAQQITPAPLVMRSPVGWVIAYWLLGMAFPILTAIFMSMLRGLLKPGQTFCMRFVLPVSMVAPCSLVLLYNSPAELITQTPSNVFGWKTEAQLLLQLVKLGSLVMTSGQMRSRQP